MSEPVRARRVMADLHVDDLDAAKDFYSEFLGLEEQSLGLDWVTRFVSADGATSVQLLTRDATAPEDPAISVHVDDVQRAYAEARRRGYEIVVPLRREPWGVHRFFVRAPDGTVVNVVHHPPGHGAAAHES